MKILLVNDDGIRGEGLVALVKELYGKHDLHVVAPKGECSGNSHHLTFNRAIAVTKTTIPGYEDVPAYYVDGTPADCSRIALTELFDDMPDLCISGINKGPNLGVNIHWSGTLGAAVQATEHGVRAIALSHVCFEPTGFEYAAKFAGRLIEKLDGFGLPQRTVLNVNFPNLNEVTPKKVVVTKVSRTNWFSGYHVVRAVDENTTEYRVDPTYRADDGPGDDDYEIRQGNISISPLLYDYTDYGSMEKIKSVENMIE